MLTPVDRGAGSSVFDNLSQNDPASSVASKRVSNASFFGKKPFTWRGEGEGGGVMGQDGRVNNERMCGLAVNSGVN